jgi:AcrR family transcriptional regulator
MKALVIGSSRGRYDRGATASERARAQHEAFINAGFGALIDGSGLPHTVAQLVAAARSSKNTFYSHFDSMEQYHLALAEAGMERLRGALAREVQAELSTPVQALQQCCEAWLRMAQEHEGELRAVLQLKRSAVQGLLTELIADPILAGQRSGLLPVELGPVKSRCVEACLLGVLDVVERGRSVSESARLLSEVLIRVLR